MQSGKTGTATERMFNIEAGTNALAPGAHTINIQVSDKDGVQSSPVSRLFYNQGSNTVNDFLYWFDGNAREMQTVTNADGHYDLDVSKLGTGIHFLNYMFRDASGKLTTIKHDCFYRIANTGVMKFSYWFDGDRASMQTVPLPRDVMMIDLSNLSEGFHTIHCMVSDNQTTSFETRMFLKVPKIEGNDVEMTCICTVDGKLVAQDKLPSSGGILNYNFDVNKLSVGLHKTVFQIIAPTGAASNIVERYFIRTTTNAEIGSMKCVYAIDDMKTYTQAGTMQNGLFHFDLDVATLVDGLHRLAYMLVSDDGTSTPLETAYFWKTPVGGPGIIQYDYWLNESDNIHTVKLKDRTNPLSLITLLPVEQEPIRSSCFHFEVKENQPMIYAKNDFHIAFYDVTGRRLDKSKQFVDYNVSQTVSDIAELQKTQTFAKVDENKIKWFKFHAEAGDTIALQASQATSIQIFSPSGEEIYSASGSNSVEYGGCHTWEAGTHYVAVHDVKGSNADVSLDYMHMDKYDVVGQDVNVVGNGGYSTITYKGNGFRDLCSVELKSDKGTVIKSITVGHESDASSTVTFDFTDAEKSDYTALFHFTQEDKVASSIIRVEEATDIELITTVTYPTNFLQGTSTIYTINVANKGNSTAYVVPVIIQIHPNEKWDEIQSINVVNRKEIISSENVDVGEAADDIVNDIYKTVLSEIDDKSYFIKIQDEDMNLEYGWGEFFVNIPPLSEYNIEIEIKSLSNVTLLGVVPSDWSIVKTENSQNVRKRKQNVQDGICCHKDQIECAVSGAAFLSSFTAYGCVGSLADFTLKKGLELWCKDYEDAQKALEENAKSKLSSLGAEILSVVADCLLAHFDGIANGIKKAIADKEELYRKALDESSKCLAERESWLKAKKYLENEGKKYESLGDYEKANISYDQAEDAGKQAEKWQQESNKYYDEAHNISDEIAGLNTEHANVMKQCREALKKAWDSLSASISGSKCVVAFTKQQPNCPPTPPQGGLSSPLNSCEPNDIHGYTSESGSMHMRNDIEDVVFIIDSENDPVFADAPAHTVIITDTIDSRYYDLESLSTRNVTIGDVSMELDGIEQNFIKTMDLRPRINVIAQVEQKYDTKTGIATWIWTSLDPMTMEPTSEVMQGVLPVNNESHIGEGHITYHLKQKTGLPDGSELTNQANIIFDSNEPVFTPVWTNTIDAVAPTSTITSSEMLDGGMVRLNFDGEDARSGIWKYTLYAQYGAGTSWEKVAEVDTTCYDFQYYADMDYGFCVMATDSAGNVEQKEFKREYELQSFLRGDVNCDGKITISDAVGIVNFVIRANTTGLNGIAADANQDGNVSISDAVFVVNQVIRADQNHVKAEQKKEVNASLAVHSMKVTPGDCFELPVVLNGDPGCISALQLDLSLPDGLMLEDVGCDRSHNVSHAVQAGGKERIAVLSTDNAVFPGNGESVIVLYLKTAPDFVEGTVSIDDIELVTPSVTAIHPAMVNATIGTSDATAVDGIGDNAEQGDVYNMQGQRATKHSRGVVIQNKKKKIRK